MNNTNEQPKPTTETPAVIDKVPGMPVEIVPVDTPEPQDIIDRVPGMSTEEVPAG
ncbi:hypothetical protein KC968_01785 [Candidatus Saccharibacteria bacterium]|nr:hypothetical protein [Candidatus Saccharibacteria bacterium]